MNQINGMRGSNNKTKGGCGKEWSATWLALCLRCTNENDMFSFFIEDICLCFCLLAYFIWTGTDAESWVITTKFLYMDTLRIAEWMQSCPSWVIGIVEIRLDGSEISTQIRQILSPHSLVVWYNLFEMGQAWKKDIQVW